MRPRSGPARTGTPWCIVFANVRVTPDSRFGFVEVACRPTADGGTEASIAYTFTALSTAGRSYLSELTEDAFANMIEGWKLRIDAWLQV